MLPSLASGTPWAQARSFRALLVLNLLLLAPQAGFGQNNPLTVTDGIRGILLQNDAGGVGSHRAFIALDSDASDGIASGSDYLYLARVGNDSFIGSAGAGSVLSLDASSVLLQTGGVSRLVVASGGNVGIGTTDPYYKLTLRGAGNAGQAVFAIQDSDNGDKEWRIDQNAGALRFIESGVAAHMVIVPTGKVGIGTNSPQTALHVAVPATDGVAGGTANSYPITQFKIHAGGGAARGLEIGAPTGSVTSPVYLKVHGTANRFALLNESNTEQVTVLTSGNVGIGTTSPTHKLAVNGAIRAKEVIVDTGWADYVFADDYALKPLAEVEAHIKEKKHLPGIPSAAEVAEHGVSLGEMQARMMATMEEMMLHLIRIEKENAELREQVKRIATAGTPAP